MVITYEDSDLAVRAFYTLRESCYDDKNLLGEYTTDGPEVCTTITATVKSEPQPAQPHEPMTTTTPPPKKKINEMTTTKYIPIKL